MQVSCGYGDADITPVVVLGMNEIIRYKKEGILIMKKKLFAMMLMCSLMIAIMCGCGAENVTIDTGALADDIYAGVTWQDQIGEVDLSKALSLYGISSDAVSSGKVYISTNATAEEIAVLEASSSDNAGTIKSAVEARVASQKASFESYNAAEVPKLENPLIVTKGNYVIMVVCDNVSEAQTIIDDAFAAK